jgi:hypothetical protein
MLCSCFFSYSYSVRRGGRYSYLYSKRPSIAIRPIGPQVPANRFNQRSAWPQVQTAIEYEYRFAEYRFAEYEYEYDEIRCEARTMYLASL